MQAFKRCLKACKRLKIGLFGLFSCYFGMMSEKVLSSELSKVVRKIQFALFRKIKVPKNIEPSSIAIIARKSSDIKPYAGRQM